MAKNHTNQEHNSEKHGTFPDQPSKAPGQDQDGREFVGSAQPERHHADDPSERQGISNRPAAEEHAFPDSDGSQTEEAQENGRMWKRISPNSTAATAAGCNQTRVRWDL